MDTQERKLQHTALGGYFGALIGWAMLAYGMWRESWPASAAGLIVMVSAAVVVWIFESKIKVLKKAKKEKADVQ